MLMALSVSDTIPTPISKILWNELEAEQSKRRRDLWLRKHCFLKNIIFISLRKDNVQYFHNNNSSEHALLFIIKLKIELSLVLAF